MLQSYHHRYYEAGDNKQQNECRNRNRRLRSDCVPLGESTRLHRGLTTPPRHTGQATSHSITTGLKLRHQALKTITDRLVFKSRDTHYSAVLYCLGPRYLTKSVTTSRSGLTDYADPVRFSSQLDCDTRRRRKQHKLICSYF